MLTFMQETCNKNIDLLDNFAGNGQSFELREMFGKFTMDTIASCAFGLDPQASTHKGRFLYNLSTFRWGGTLCFKWGFTRTFSGNQDVAVKCQIWVVIEVPARP